MVATIGGRLPAGGLAVMVAQHVVTMPVFDALFAGSGFADRNPISMALNELLDEFKTKDIRLRDETVALDRFYDSVRTRLSGAADSDARLKVMLEGLRVVLQRGHARRRPTAGDRGTPPSRLSTSS